MLIPITHFLCFNLIMAESISVNKGLRKVNDKNSIVKRRNELPHNTKPFILVFA